MTDTNSSKSVFHHMGEAERFRARAAQCRHLADDARDDESRHTLNDMAKELEDEAVRIDAEEAETAAKPTDA